MYNKFIEFCDREDVDFVEALGEILQEFHEHKSIIKDIRKPFRSQVYLQFIRNKPCMLCRKPAPSDPHHEGRRGLGQKTDDTKTVPLCRRCHREYHDMRDRNEKDKIKLDMIEFISDYQTEFIKTLFLK